MAVLNLSKCHYLGSQLQAQIYPSQSARPATSPRRVQPQQVSSSTPATKFLQALKARTAAVKPAAGLPLAPAGSPAQATQQVSWPVVAQPPQASVPTMPPGSPPPAALPFPVGGFDPAAASGGGGGFGCSGGSGTGGSFSSPGPGFQSGSALTGGNGLGSTPQNLSLMQRPGYQVGYKDDFKCT